MRPLRQRSPKSPTAPAAELVTNNTLAVPNGQAMPVKVRDAKSVRVTAAGPTGCQLDVVGLTASPFDADVYVVKVDTGNVLNEGGAGKANNEGGSSHLVRICSRSPPAGGA